jgi:hypothetical protein
MRGDEAVEVAAEGPEFKMGQLVGQALGDAQ